MTARRPSNRPLGGRLTIAKIGFLNWFSLVLPLFGPRGERRLHFRPRKKARDHYNNTLNNANNALGGAGKQNYWVIDIDYDCCECGNRVKGGKVQLFLREMTFTVHDRDGPSP